MSELLGVKEVFFGFNIDSSTNISFEIPLIYSVDIDLNGHELELISDPDIFEPVYIYGKIRVRNGSLLIDNDNKEENGCFALFDDYSSVEFDSLTGTVSGPQIYYCDKNNSVIIKNTIFTYIYSGSKKWATLNPLLAIFVDDDDPKYTGKTTVDDSSKIK